MMPLAIVLRWGGMAGCSKAGRKAETRTTDIGCGAYKNRSGILGCGELRSCVRPPNAPAHQTHRTIIVQQATPIMSSENIEHDIR